MKILYVTPGSGDRFFCGNCLRDALYARALQKAGHEVVVMPLYLPVASMLPQAPLFFAAPAYWLENMLGRGIPRWLERLLSGKALLRAAAARSGTTSARGLERMTLSMIEGREPAFRAQALEMAAWAKTHFQPDVVHLSSSLLIGLAGFLKEELRAKVVCSLQDEEVWIESMREPFVAQAWSGIAQNAAHVDRFVTTSCFYQAWLRQKLPSLGEVPVIYPGLDLDGCPPPARPSRPTIGFLHRMNESGGLERLVDAFCLLKERGVIPNLQLRITGGCTQEDEPFLRRIRGKLRPHGESARIIEPYHPGGNAEFLRGVDLLSVPSDRPEAIGLHLCEAMAAGRPLVQPALGATPEIVGPAGILYQPNDAPTLAAAIETLLSDPQRYDACRESALCLARERYSDRVAASALTALYASI